jgi:hypothetical protein
MRDTELPDGVELQSDIDEQQTLCQHSQLLEKQCTRNDSQEAAANNTEEIDEDEEGDSRSCRRLDEFISLLEREVATGKCST